MRTWLWRPNCLLQTKSESPTDSAKVRKRIPRPPTKLRMKCAFFWSCCACLVGNFLCAIPALRYSVTVSFIFCLLPYPFLMLDFFFFLNLGWFVVAVAVLCLFAPPPPPPTHTPHQSFSGSLSASLFRMSVFACRMWQCFMVPCLCVLACVMFLASFVTQCTIGYQCRMSNIVLLNMGVWARAWIIICWSVYLYLSD